MENKYGTIYLLKPNEYIRTNENIYKIGMTVRDHNNRMAEYEKDSDIIIARNVLNTADVERRLINMFNINFTLVKGREYFKGIESEMTYIINNVIDNEKKLYDKSSQNNNTKKVIINNQLIIKPPEEPIIIENRI
jgi:hypothetical protein